MEDKHTSKHLFFAIKHKIIRDETLSPDEQTYIRKVIHDPAGYGIKNYLINFYEKDGKFYLHIPKAPLEDFDEDIDYRGRCFSALSTIHKKIFTKEEASEAYEIPIEDLDFFEADFLALREKGKKE